MQRVMSSILNYIYSSFDQELGRTDIVPAEYSRILAWAERNHANHPLKDSGRLQDRVAAVSALALSGLYVHPKVLEHIIQR